MQKRVLSLVLVLCMLLTLVPAMALPVFAEETTATVTFIDGNGTTVSTQTVTGATLEFTVPEVPSDAFGWYVITPAGAIYEASTMIGEAAADVTFYLLEKKSTFSPTTNWPLYTSKTSLDGYRGGWTAGSYIDNAYDLFETVNTYDILENKGLWTYGGIYLGERRMVTQKRGMLTLSYNVPANGVIDVDFEALRIDRNTDGCVFSDTSMAIAINGVIVWPASAAGQKVKNNPVTGTNYTFLYNNQNQNTETTFVGDIETDWAYFALLGQEVPENYTDLSDMTVEALGFDYKNYMGLKTNWDNKLAAAKTALEEAEVTGDEAAIATAEAAVAAAEEELEKYLQVRALCRPVTEVAKTGSLLSAYEAYCAENGYPHDLAVKAGDRVDIVFNRVNNPHITAFPTVTYSKVTSAPIAQDTVYAYDFVGSELVANGTNWPVIGEKTTYYPLLSDFTDGWSFIGYDAGVVSKQGFPGTYMSYGNWPVGILWLDDCGISRCNIEGKAPSFQDYGAGFAYAVPYAGTVNIDAIFGTPIASASRTVYFSIYKSNADGMTLVYPAAGATGANIADAATEGAGVKYNATGTKNEAVTGVEVAVGDQLVFVWRDSNIVNVTGWSNGDFANAFNLKVTYTEYLPGSTFDPLNGMNKPQHGTTAGDKATFTGGWDLVSHAGLTEYTAGAQINTVISNITGNDGWLSNGYVGDIWKKPAGVTFAYKGVDHDGWPNGYGVIPALDTTGGWRYTAEFDGTLNLSLNSLFSKHNAGTFGYVAVFHNGEMIWPMAEGEGENYYGSSDKWAAIGTYNTKLDAAAIAALAVKDGSAKTGSLTGIAVQAGDEIEILVRNDESATGFWISNRCGFMATATVAYTECDLDSAIVDPMFTTRLDENLPSAPAADQTENFVYAPVFGDPARSFVNFPKEQITKENAVTDYFAINRSEAATSWSDGFWGYNDGANRAMYWGENTVFRMIGNADWGPTGSLSCNNWAIGGYRYTAPSAGKIDIDVTKLWTMATNAKVTVGEGEDAVEVPQKNGAITVAIFIDCQKVWPAGDAWYVLVEQGVDYAADVAASIDAALTDVIVGDGSTIDFLVGNPNNLDAWASRGTEFQAAVTYKEQYPVFATGAVSVGDSFTFEANATAGIAQNIKADVITTAAKDVCNKFAYTVTGEIDGKTVTLATGVTTMKDALMAYVTTDTADKASNVAIASLNYAAAAQKYFNTEIAAADLANAGLSETQKTVTTAGEYTAADRVAEVENATAKLIGISLLLEEKIALKLVFDTDVEGAKVQMADNADFTGATEVAYTATKEGGYYKAITEGIGAANYNSLIYFRVVDADGVVISNTIAYSVAAYCNNMQDNAAVAPVANAILALYDAAAAYKA
ncbi:MAG: hypothetical protein IJY20_02040 [Clostridia bacterium]|nr:hypothetical protein [Clostridia bacterium]